MPTFSRSAEAPRRRGWWPRFGLRALLIAGIVFSLLCGWVGRNLLRMRQQDAAIERLKAVGAVLYDTPENEIWRPHPDTPTPYTASSPPPPSSRIAEALGIRAAFRVTAVTFRDDSNGKDEVLDALLAFPELRRVYLTGDGFTDEGLVTLAKLPALELLSLDRTGVTGAGFAKFAAPERIRSLYLASPHEEADLLRAIGDMTELRTVDLFQGSVSTEDVAALANLPRLEELNLRHSKLDEDLSLDRLGDSTTLRRLEFSSTPVADFQVKALARIEAVEELRLYETGLTDEGLAELSDLLQLNAIHLGPPVTRDAAIAFSRQALDCVVFHWRADGELARLKAGQILPTETP